MSANSEGESSFDLDGGVDLFIQDTQLDNPSSLVAQTSSEHCENVDEVAPSDDESKGFNAVVQCTQVDNGEYSDEDSYMGDGDMYGATQVDDNYLRRLAESEELLEQTEQNVQSIVAVLGSDLATNTAVVNHSTGEPTVHMDETYVPTEDIERCDVPKSSSEALPAESGGQDRAELTGTEEPRKPEQSHDDDSEEEDEGDYVDFCIADTQPPTRHSSLHNKLPSTTPAVGAAPASEVATEPATMYPEDQQDETHLTVYDYLSLSAPLSHEVAKPDENVFSALDVPSHPLPTAATSASMSSTAFATAKTGTMYRTPRLGSKDAPLNVEESPTQLDGSLHLSGDSHSVGGSLASHISGSSHSVLLSGEEALLVAEKEKSPDAVAPAVQAAAANPVARADTGGEWLSTKNPKPPALPPMAPTLLRLTPQKSAPVSPVNVSTSSGSKAVRAGESETQLFDVEDSQALGDALDGKSLEELVRMQEKLSRAIHSKTQNVTIHTPRQTEATALEKASAKEAGASEAGHVPLARQQTSYGLSQPSNMAVSSLMMLKTTTEGDKAAISPASTERRKYNTFAADPALAAVTPAGSNASHSANEGGSAGSATSNTSATHTPSPDSSARKFLKRKFGKPQSHVQALAAVAEEANLQFEMSDEGDEDSEVPSPGSSDNEGKSIKTKVAKAPGAKAADKAAPAGGTNTGSKSKVRRIIIEDTQEEPDDDQVHDDKETQRVDDEDAEFTADYFVRSPVPAAAAPTAAASKNSESDAIAKALPADFPKFFLQKIPVKFSELWHALTDIGWFWKRGGGIVSYYYVRPNCLVKKGFVMGRDYFGDENEVNKYVTKVVSEARAALKKQGIDVAPPAPPKAVLAPYPRPAASSSASNATVSAKPSAPSNNTSNTAASSTKVPHIPTARQLVPQFSTVSVTSGLLPPDDPCMSDIRRIPWKWLWKLLRERDWTWDFGPAHTNFYFAPGYDIRSKHAVLGEHKFDSEESVRRFVRKQNWPEFAKQQQRDEHSSAESQLPDAYLKDPTWQLASHRQKREREARPSDEDNNSSEGEEGGNDFVSKSVASKTHAKKAAKTVEIVVAPRASAVSKTAAVKSGKSAASGQSQKRNFTPEYDEPEQATQAQRMSQVSPLKKKPTGAPDAGLFFLERRFVVSGIPEKLKAQLIKDIGKLGGKILSTVPVDGNESRDDVEVDEKTGRAARKGPIYVVSHPREFRKPNYLMALATGVTLVHNQWITDCKEANKWLPTESYLLPSGCCALHAYNIFPNRQSSADTTPKGKSKGGLGPALVEPLLEGIKVLNFAGSGWDNLLLTAGATTVESEEPLLQALQSLGQRASSGSKGGRQSRAPVDVILVDPYEYSLSVAASRASNVPGGSRYNTPNSLLALGASSKGKSTAGAGTPKSPASKLGESELLVIQHCVELNAGEGSTSLGSLSAMKTLPLHQRQIQQASAAPIVVTTDWLVHCVAMGEVLDHAALDLFTLPPEPETRPFTYKADMVTGTGERYSKYDIVYYRSVKQQNLLANRTSTVRSSPSKAAKNSEVLSLGKITGFVRRDDKSQLFARIRPLISTHDEDQSGTGDFNPKGKIGEKDLARVRHKELVGDPLNALAMVEVERLSGKAILLHKDDFLRVSRYSFSDDSVYYASSMWTEENPPVLGGGSGDGSQEEDSQGMMMRVQRSQDY